MTPTLQALADTGIAFAILFVVFLPLERLFPARQQRVFRAEWGTDLLFFLGQYLLWTAPVVAALVWLQRNVGLLPLEGVHAFVAAQPFWLQCVGVIAISDLAIYWGHRLSHTNRFLWRFHRVHHTAPHVDWLAAHREHPLDNLYTRAIENLPLILLGFPLEALAGFAVFRGLWAIYIHSNVSLMPGPLRFVIGGPRLHHWHHARGDGPNVNFANLSPLMDLAFGTYHDPGHGPERFGISEELPHGYLAQMLEPFGFRGHSRRIRGAAKGTQASG